MPEDAVHFTHCSTCEKGVMVPTMGPGRRVLWARGVIRELPRGLPVRRCTVCGEVYLDADEVQYLASLWGVST